MTRPIDNYPHSTNQNAQVLLDAVRPAALYNITLLATATNLSFSDEDANCIVISSPIDFYISFNPAISSYAQLLAAGSSRIDNVYYGNSMFIHKLIVPQDIKVFASADSVNKILIQEIIMWGALSGTTGKWGSS